MIEQFAQRKGGVMISVLDAGRQRASDAAAALSRRHAG